MGEKKTIVTLDSEQAQLILFGQTYYFQNECRKDCQCIKSLPGPKIRYFVKYGKTELTPPTPMELVGVVPQLAKLVLSTVTFQFRHLTMTQCAVNTAVAAE